MVEGVLEDTVDEFKAHPWIWGGVALAAIALVWFVSSSSSASSASGGNFTFSYGPSDANVAAGTQLAISQAADQTAVNINNAKLAASTSVAGDYFNYLATSQATAADVNSTNNATALAIASEQQQVADANISAGVLENWNANTAITSLANTNNFGVQPNPEAIAALASLPYH